MIYLAESCSWGGQFCPLMCWCSFLQFSILSLYTTLVVALDVKVIGRGTLQWFCWTHAWYWLTMVIFRYWTKSFSIPLLYLMFLIFCSARVFHFSFLFSFLQYNCISLGLTIGAVTAILSDKDLLACFLFSLALNHKQVASYFDKLHSTGLPYYFYLRKLFPSFFQVLMSLYHAIFLTNSLNEFVLVLRK